MSSIIRECVSNKLDFFVLHTGQHYTYNLDKAFFEQLELPDPKYNIESGSNNQGKQTADILAKAEEILLKEKPDVVLVQGDTNSVLAGALAAAKLYIKVGHVEAGLRSYDREMPEEINRILTDHISDYLFCPTKKAQDIALKEGIEESKIFLTGNTIVDAVLQNLKISQTKADILKKLGIEKGKYMLITAHRPSNVDNKESLQNLLNGFELVYNEYKLPLIYPIHPRTKKMLEKFNLKVPDGLKLIEPLSFLEFLQLEANSKLILTDSGGIQEEACILKIPCVTLRENTERPETIDVNANVLAGNDPDRILECAKEMLSKSTNWQNPFGDGKSAKKIIEILLS